MKTIGLVSLLMISSFLPALSQACSCFAHSKDPETRVADALAYADVVFLGVVEAVDRPSGAEENSGRGLEETTFYVLRAWKGERATRILTRINTRFTCGISFEVGRTYLVYGNERTRDAFVTTSICTRTAPESRAAEDIEILDRIAAGGVR